jgi:hypothetical protein
MYCDLVFGSPPPDDILLPTWMTIKVSLSLGIESSAPPRPARTSGRSTRRVPRWATWLTRLVLLLVGLALPLAALELALRIAGPILPGNYATGTDLVTHPIFGHFHRPNYVGWWKTSEFTTFEQINSKGLREREIPYERTPNVNRVLILGDSFVEAIQVDASLVLSKQLEARLNRRGQHFETINAGVGGFGTANEYLFYQEEAHRYQADIVVLVVYLGNDIRNNSARLDNDARVRSDPHFTLDSAGHLRLLPSHTPRLGDQSALLDRFKQLARQTLLFNVFETGVLDKAEDEEADGSYTWSKNERVFQQPMTKDWEEAWDITEALLGALKQEVEAHGSRLVLVAAPTDLQVRPSDWERLLAENKLSPRNFDLDQPNRSLAAMSERLDLPLIDPLADLRAAEAASDSGLYYRKNRHWTVEGHTVMARAVDGGLARLRLVADDHQDGDLVRLDGPRDRAEFPVRLALGGATIQGPRFGRALTRRSKRLLRQRRLRPPASADRGPTSLPP